MAPTNMAHAAKKSHPAAKKTHPATKRRGADPQVPQKPNLPHKSNGPHQHERPDDADERKLEQGLEESMAGSDPVSIIQPAPHRPPKDDK